MLGQPPLTRDCLQSYQFVFYHGSERLLKGRAAEGSRLTWLAVPIVTIQASRSCFPFAPTDIVLSRHFRAGVAGQLKHKSLPEEANYDEDIFRTELRP